jgi:long-chain acyl-CoA synthetase
VQDGWLHTGDIGELDSEGRLFIKGRKKDVIVTSSGLNVFPEDVEPVLESTPGIREAVVVGLRQDGEETVHAVLILENATIDPSKLIQSANRLLEDHQRIHGWTVWPSDAFPRTPSTQKTKRSEVLGQIERLRSGDEGERPADGIELVLGDVVSGALGSSRRALLSEDLGFSSLDRIELMGRVEDHFGIRLDEERFSELRTVEDLERAIQIGQSSGSENKESVSELSMPKWATRWPVRLLRRSFYTFVLSPLFRNYIHLNVSGLDCLEKVCPPVLFAANHSSHLDTPAILVALPGYWRNTVTPAMLADYFAVHFEMESASFREKASNRLQYFLACGLFGAYPLPQRISGVREALRYTGDLVSRGFCPLVFPEGMRSSDGEMREFRPGIGLMAQRLGVPVVPVRIDGTHAVLSVQDSWPRRGAVSVRFGPPIVSRGTDAASITRQIEASIRDMEG